MFTSIHFSIMFLGPLFTNDILTMDLGYFVLTLSMAAWWVKIFQVQDFGVDLGSLMEIFIY